MDDTRIIDLYWQRSERAIAETDAKYGAYCRMVALNITGDARDGEECVSDTWLAAWNSMPQARPAHLSAYLAAICRNRALNLARGRIHSCAGGAGRMRRGGRRPRARGRAARACARDRRVSRAASGGGAARVRGAVLAHGGSGRYRPRGGLFPREGDGHAAPHEKEACGTAEKGGA